MKIARLISVLVLGFTLVACGSAQAGSSNSGIASANSQPTATQAGSVSDDLIRTDSQGAVEFSVQPLNLDNPGDSIVFEVSMNTHSVDLRMDLSTLATLSADNGYSVQGVSWDGTLGGHHVSGKLSFPARSDGKSILDGATKLTLSIKNIDAPERIFSWDLTK